jgi:hypothetical protein
MTDPTTRYPLPDEPGQDPFATPTEPVPADDADVTDTARTADDTDALVAADATAEPADEVSAVSAEPPPAQAERPPAAAWEPPSRRGESRWPAVIAGVFLIGLGLWFFADFTLGLEMPTIRWGQLWPIILIVVGALILYGASRRRAR